MGNLHVLEEIRNMSQQMEENGKVDSSVIKKLSELNTSIQKIQKKWIRADHSESFRIYNIMKNIESIINKMIERFKNARKKHDNPQIAKDVYSIIPFIMRILRLLESEKLTKKIFHEIMIETYKMKSKSREKNLAESKNDYLKRLGDEKFMIITNQVLTQMNNSKYY